MEKWEDDITSKTIKDNETWNTCPKCDYSWKDEIPIPGLIHRTRLCAQCRRGEWHDRNHK